MGWLCGLWGPSETSATLPWGPCRSWRRPAKRKRCRGVLWMKFLGRLFAICDWAKSKAFGAPSFFFGCLKAKHISIYFLPCSTLVWRCLLICQETAKSRVSCNTERPIRFLVGTMRPHKWPVSTVSLRRTDARLMSFLLRIRGATDELPFLVDHVRSVRYAMILAPFHPYQNSQTHPQQPKKRSNKHSKPIPNETNLAPFRTTAVLLTKLGVELNQRPLLSCHAFNEVGRTWLWVRWVVLRWYTTWLGKACLMFQQIPRVRGTEVLLERSTYWLSQPPKSSVSATSTNFLPSEAMPSEILLRSFERNLFLPVSKLLLFSSLQEQAGQSILKRLSFPQLLGQKLIEQLWPEGMFVHHFSFWTR